jgi:hypothetical protein
MFSNFFLLLFFSFSTPLHFLNHFIFLVHKKTLRLRCVFDCHTRIDPDKYTLSWSEEDESSFSYSSGENADVHIQLFQQILTYFLRQDENGFRRQKSQKFFDSFNHVEAE